MCIILSAAELAAREVQERRYIFNEVLCDTLGLIQSVKQLLDNLGKSNIVQLCPPNTAGTDGLGTGLAAAGLT